MHIAEEIAFAVCKRQLLFLMVQVHLVLQPVVLAPVALRLEEAITKHVRKHVVVVRPGAQLLRSQHRRLRLQKDRKVRPDVVPLLLFETRK